MNLRTQFRTFWSSLLSEKNVTRHRHSGDSLAKAADEAGRAAAIGFGGTSDSQAEIIGDAHERYNASFVEDD